MKKQILQFLGFIVLALLAGTTNSYGQLVSVAGSAPRPLVGCIDDALHPLPGKEYIYQSTATPSGGSYTWWATKDPNFISTDATSGVTSNNLSTALTVADNDLISVGTSYGVSSADDNVAITWTSNLLSNTIYNTDPTFVVVQYEDVDGCTDNLKVYQLDPLVAFTVDIKNIDESDFSTLDYDVQDEQCIDVVRGATFVTDAMVYDYGTNVFYYEVVAANFVDSWTPTFEVTGLNAVQTAVVEYTADTDLSTATWVSSGDVTTTATDTSAGVSIYVRVTVTNNNYEGLTDQTFALAVAGTDSTGQLDLNNADCSTPADAATAMLDDYAEQVQTARPELPSTTTSPTAPNIELIPGNEVNN